MGDKPFPPQRRRPPERSRTRTQTRISTRKVTRTQTGTPTGLAKFSKSWASIDRCWSEFGRKRQTSTRCRPKFVVLGQALVEMCSILVYRWQISSKIGRFVPTSGQNWSSPSPFPAAASACGAIGVPQGVLGGQNVATRKGHQAHPLLTMTPARESCISDAPSATPGNSRSLQCPRLTSLALCRTSPRFAHAARPLMLWRVI